MSDLDAQTTGDSSRSARLLGRVARLKEEQEACSLRELAKDAVRRKEQQEAVTEGSASLYPSEHGGGAEKSFRDCVIEEEIRRVRQEVPRPPLVAALLDMVHLEFRTTPSTALTVKLQFPLGYPQDPLIIDMPSSTLHSDLVAKLRSAALQEASRLCPAAQVLATYQFLASFLESNLLASAYGDLQSLREVFESTKCKVSSARERSGTVSVFLQEGQYEMLVRCSVPREYPQGPVMLELQQTNLPRSLAAAFMAQAEERARGLAEPPQIALPGSSGAVGREGAGTGPASKAAKQAREQTHLSRKQELELQAAAEEAREAALKAQRQAAASFVAQPSLFPAVRFLWQDCLRPLAFGTCAACGKRLLPAQPSMMEKIPKGMGVEQLYCGHMYHGRCLDEYLSQPPFDKGCKRCGARISHPKFITDPQALEARWIQKQARQREIDDVREFLGQL